MPHFRAGRSPPQSRLGSQQQSSAQTEFVPMIVYDTSLVFLGKKAQSNEMRPGMGQVDAETRTGDGSVPAFACVCSQRGLEAGACRLW